MVDINSSENLASFSLFNQGTISTAAADAANAKSNPNSTSYAFLGGSSTDTLNIIGLERIAAINVVNQLGLPYLLTYTSGTSENNDTVSSATVVDGVVYIVVYQYTNTGLTLDFSGMMTGWARVENFENAGYKLRFKFIQNAANTAIAAEPSPGFNGWVGATFTISGATPYMGGSVPSVLSNGTTFTVISSSVVPGMAPMPAEVYLTTSNTTDIGSAFDFYGTATVYL